MRANLDSIVSILALSVAATFLLITFTSIISSNKHKVGRKLGRIYVNPFTAWDRNKKPFPCVVDDASSNGGIYYVRIPRGSSKGVSVTRRIAGLEGRLLDLPEGKSCKVTAPIAPIKAFHQKFGDRDKANSFLWSMIRSPERRAISHFGLRLRSKEVEATNESFINDLSTSVSYQPNIELRSLSMEDVSASASAERYADLVNHVLAEYNFIGVEERMKESLVVLSMLIGTNVNHVIYDFSRCIQETAPEWLTPEMTEYLESKWKQSQAGDYLLYTAVNKALDLTIKQLDQEEFNARMEKFDSIMSKWTEASTIVKGRPGCGAAFEGKHHADMIEWVNDLPDHHRKRVLKKQT